MTAITSLTIALLFATIFLFGGRLAYRPGQKNRHRFLSFAAGIAAGLLPVLATYGRKLGGYTGDALGAAVCLGTLGHLAFALALSGVL